MDLATSGKGGIGPFIGLCVLSACFGVADAHVQGGMVGELSFMCTEFIQVDIVKNSSIYTFNNFCHCLHPNNLIHVLFDAMESFLAGLAASGFLASGLRLLTKVSFEKSHNGLRKGASMFLLFY